MEKEQIEKATDIVIDSIEKSNLEPLTKLELLINMRTFFEDYNDNILLLGENKKKKRFERF